MPATGATGSRARQPQGMTTRAIDRFTAIPDDATVEALEQHGLAAGQPDFALGSVHAVGGLDDARRLEGFAPAVATKLTPGFRRFAPPGEV